MSSIVDNMMSFDAALSNEINVITKEIRQENQHCCALEVSLEKKQRDTNNLKKLESELGDEVDSSMLMIRNLKVFHQYLKESTPELQTYKTRLIGKLNLEKEKSAQQRLKFQNIITKYEDKEQFFLKSYNNWPIVVQLNDYKKELSQLKSDLENIMIQNQNIELKLSTLKTEKTSQGIIIETAKIWKNTILLNQQIENINENKTVMDSNKKVNIEEMESMELRDEDRSYESKNCSPNANASIDVEINFKAPIFSQNKIERNFRPQENITPFKFPFPCTSKKNSFPDYGVSPKINLTSPDYKSVSPVSESFKRLMKNIKSPSVPSHKIPMSTTETPVPSRELKEDVETCQKSPSEQENISPAHDSIPRTPTFDYFKFKNLVQPFKSPSFKNKFSKSTFVAPNEELTRETNDRDQKNFKGSFQAISGFTNEPRMSADMELDSPKNPKNDKSAHLNGPRDEGAVHWNNEKDLLAAKQPCTDNAKTNFDMFTNQNLRSTPSFFDSQCFMNQSPEMEDSKSTLSFFHDENPKSQEDKSGFSFCFNQTDEAYQPTSFF